MRVRLALIGFDLESGELTRRVRRGVARQRCSLSDMYISTLSVPDSHVAKVSPTAVAAEAVASPNLQYSSVDVSRAKHRIYAHVNGVRRRALAGVATLYSISAVVTTACRPQQYRAAVLRATSRSLESLSIIILVRMARVADGEMPAVQSSQRGCRAAGRPCIRSCKSNRRPH